MSNKKRGDSLMKKTRLVAFVLALVVLACTFAVPVSAESITFQPELSNGKIYGIPIGATVGVIKQVYYNAVVEVTTAKGVVLANNEMIGTGYIVKINGISYTAVVLGDIDGDANLTATDYIMIKRVYLGTYSVDNIFIEAADVNVDGGQELDAINYIMVKRYYMKTYDMNYRYSCDPYDPVEDESGWTDGWV
jgi:hypothetical protein